MTKCNGSGQPPRLKLVNDWWVGTTGLCPVCNRNLKLTKGEKIPNHKAK